MKGVFSILSVSLWAASLGAAQSLAEVVAATPPCALPCLASELPAANCSLTDFEALPSCACTNITLQASLANCVQLACPFEEQAEATLLLGGICAEFPKDSRVLEVKATAIACLVLTIVFVFLRCISRFLISSRLWWDDWMTLLATASLIALTSVYVAASDLGFGLHYWDLNPYNAPKILQLFYSSQLLYVVIQVTAKVAILTVFWRIFTAKWLRRTIWGCVAFLVGHGTLFLFLVAFQCSPVHAVWDRTIQGKCINVTAVAWAGAIFSILEDLVILALPLPEVLKLQLSFKKKVAVCLMFSIGSFACVTSMVRLRYMVTFANSVDATWDNVDIIIWSIIEVTCAIICGSLPTLRPLLLKVPHLLTSVKASEYARGGPTPSGTQDGNSRVRSHAFGPGPVRKLSAAPWETENNHGKTGVQATSSVTSVDTRRPPSEYGNRESQDDFEMGVLAREKSTV